MKKKELDCIKLKLVDNNDKEFLLALYYFYNSKVTKNMLFSSQFTNYVYNIPLSFIEKVLNKNRSNSLQVMLITTDKNLDNLVDLKLIEKKENLINLKIEKKLKYD